MNSLTEQAPILVFPFGNPSRGDDALGPTIYQLLGDKQQMKGPPSVDLLTDFQLQIEHSIDLENRDAIVFVDASVSCRAPYEFHAITPQADNSYTSHAMSPASVLAVYRQVNKCAPPPAWLLTIRGYDFSLGRSISTKAEHNLQQAHDFLRRLLSTDNADWHQYENAGPECQ